MKAPKKAPVRRYEFTSTTDDLLALLRKTEARTDDNDFRSGFKEVVDNGNIVQAVFVYPEKVIPMAAVKKKMNDWLNEYKRVNGKNPSKALKQDAKEDIVNKLYLHIPTTYKEVYTIFRYRKDDVWDAFILTNSAKMLDSFISFLPKDFVCGQSAYIDAVHAVASKVSSDFDPSVYIEDEDYRDFLTWLLYTVSANSFKEFGGMYAVSIGDSVSVADDDDFTKCVITGDFAEAKTGIYAGKKVFNLEFALEYDNCSKGQTVKLLADTSGDIQSLTFNSDNDEDSFGEQFVDAYRDFRDFLENAVFEYLSLKVDNSKWDDYNNTLKEWGRGEICVRAFDDV